ncbi:MAG: hypothetical protein AAFZ65_19630, partial [Planctomycetota bacterium]
MTRRDVQTDRSVLRHSIRQHPNPWAPATLVAALLVGCQTTAESQSVEDLIQRARYSEAVDLAESRAEESPVDAEAKRELERARVAWLLDRAIDHNLADEFA